MAKRKFSDEEWAQARMKIYMVMMQHIGPDNKIGMGELYREVFGRDYSHRINDTKEIRDLITDMRQNGQPVMSNSSASNGGYWLAASKSEINDWCDKSKARALAILHRISTAKKISLPEYIGQIAIDFKDPALSAGEIKGGPPKC